MQGILLTGLRLAWLCPPGSWKWSGGHAPSRYIAVTGPHSLTESQATEPRPSSEQIWKQLISRTWPSLKDDCLQASPSSQPTFDSTHIRMAASGWLPSYWPKWQAGDRWQVARMEMTVSPWRLSLVLGTVGEGLPPTFSPLVGSGDTCSSTSLAAKPSTIPAHIPLLAELEVY